MTLLHVCALGERSSGGIWKFRTSSFKCYIDHSHTVYSSGNIDVRNWVHLFESRCISIVKPTRCTMFRVYWISLDMFRTVFPSIIRSPRLYIQHQVYIIQFSWLLASGNEVELRSSTSFPLASSQLTCMIYTWCCMCSLGLLMMDGKTVRNMSSDIQ